VIASSKFADWRQIIFGLVDRPGYDLRRYEPELLWGSSLTLLKLTAEASATYIVSAWHCVTQTAFGSQLSATFGLKGFQE